MAAVALTGGELALNPKPDLFLSTQFSHLIMMMMVSMMMLSMMMSSMMMLSTMMLFMMIMTVMILLKQMMNDGDCKNDDFQPNFHDNVDNGTVGFAETVFKITRTRKFL